LEILGGEVQPWEPAKLESVLEEQRNFADTGGPLEIKVPPDASQSPSAGPGKISVQSRGF